LLRVSTLELRGLLSGFHLLNAQERLQMAHIGEDYFLAMRAA
jgi:hypothetical protein